MSEFLRNLSFRKKLIGTILFITLTALLLVLLTIYSYNNKNLKGRMVRELFGLSEIIGNNIMNTVIYQDNKNVQQLLQALLQNKNILGIYILNSNNEVFVKHLRENEPLNVKIPANLENGYQFTENTLEVLKNFYDGEELVIKLFIVSNLHELDEQKQAFFKLTAIVFIIAIMYISITSYILQKPIINPVLELVEMTKDVTEFRDFTIRVENKYGNSEIGILFHGFNTMLENIEDQSNSLIEAFTAMSGQKREIEQQKDKIDKQTQELQITYSELQQHSREVTESIRYAKKIQDSTLPSVSTIEKDLPKSFILYKPRDIVSGDFYWHANIYDKIYIAAVDCTGHGVPGTLLSIIGHSMLNQILHDYGIFKPSEILDYLDKGMRQIFNTKIDNNEEQIEGMDLALCMIDIDEEMLEFAGAINPVYIVRDNEIIELKGDPFSIVSNLNADGKPYTNHIFPIQPDDTLYMFSDGYPDQLGGPEMRKIKKTGLKKLLLEVNELEMEDQYEFFDNYFNNWKKDFDQVDDVLLIGIRI